MNRTAFAAMLGVSLLAVGLFVANSNILAPVSSRASATAVAPSDLALAQVNVETATLKVDGLWCPSCSYIVRSVLMEVPGVLDAKVSMFAKTATVTYDPTQTEVEALVAATTDYGFPSAVLR
ncbi:MAG: cation transporter [Gammaproteobacteria bacterium]